MPSGRNVYATPPPLLVNAEQQKGAHLVVESSQWFLVVVNPAIAIAAIACSFDALLWLWLYLRPSPFGQPFALDPAHYVFHALYYAVWAHAWVALPFVALAWYKKRSSRLQLAAQLVLSTGLLLVGAVDRECQRFLGMHASMAWLRSYAAVERTPDVIWETLRQDRGGAWSSLLGVLAVLVFPLLTVWLHPKIRLTLRPRSVYAFLILFVALPTAFWNWIPGGTQRRSKVRPALLSVVRELTRSEQPSVEANVLALATKRFQEHYAAHAGATDWRFVDPAFPLLKRFRGTQPPARSKKPNFVVLSLETFRAKDMASLNPEFSGAAPTPFLDALVRSPKSAYYPRYYASAIPTVHAFMSIHASLVAHPGRSIPAEATTDHVRSFPQMMREHGYYAMHFTGSDPDWDSQRVWLNRWYDEVQFHPEDDEHDRLTFRRAFARMRSVGRGQQPFLMYISSISNHTPFRAPEPALQMNNGETVVDALHNTMRYTDDVVRELYESARNEPWFDNTIWIITGDHGYDLGDRGESGGHDNLHHETTWVPLVVHGADARLPRGRQEVIGSHLDLAPTILELSDIWDDNAFMGHSLLHADANSDALVVRGGGFAHETREFSLFQARDAEPMVYRGADLAQHTPIAHYPALLLTRSRALAEAYRVLIAHVIDRDRVSPRAEPSVHIASTNTLP